MTLRSELAALPTDYQQCRENRHPWAEHNVIEEGSTLLQVQKCPRCGNERQRRLSLRKRSYGHVLDKWHIRYTAKGYLLKHLDRPLTADDLGEMRMLLIGYTP